MSESSPLTLKSLAEGTTLIVAIGFIVSVIYDWGFYRALGLDFSSIPTTTADQFRSGLLWFPPLLGAIFAYMAIEYQIQRVERGLTEKEILESSSNPDRLRRFRDGPWKFFAWMAPVCVVTYVLIGDVEAAALPVALAIVWLGFANWCYSAPLIKQRRDKRLQLGFTFIPMFGILAYFSGYNAAIDAVSRKPIEVVIERTALHEPISGKILRSLDKGVLVLTNNNFIQFIPWNQVESILNKKAYVPFRGVLCERFKLCVQTESSSIKSVQPIAKDEK